MPDSIRRGSPAARHPRDIAAYLELHIEQGRAEQAGLALGVVEAINGARRLNCRLPAKLAMPARCRCFIARTPSPRRRMDGAGGKPDPPARR